MRRTHLITVFIVLISIAAAACSPKTRPREEHEAARTWTPIDPPETKPIVVGAFEDLDLDALYSALKKGDNLTDKVLAPLAGIVLNQSYLEDRSLRSKRLLEMVKLFSEALNRELRAGNKSEKLVAYRKAYVSVLFSGCTEDLRADDCVNISVFRPDRFAARNLLLFATEKDAELAIEIAKGKSNKDCVTTNSKCREMVANRYLFLGMAFLLKRNINDDPELNFAYLKYSRLLALWLDQAGTEIGYFREVHGQVFETMVAKYKPKDLKDPEFREFVNNFNPWFYSNRQADVFRYGTRIMFDLAAKCCFYEDDKKEKVSDAVYLAIQETQKMEDEYGPSFQQVVKKLDTSGAKSFFASHQLMAEWNELKNPKSGLYDEFFYIVDRLFRGHIGSAEALMLINSANPERSTVRLNRVIQSYVRVYLAHMIFETNEFMASIYNSDEISGEEVFKEAVLRSREVTTRWHDVQYRLDLLDKFAGSYFKGLGRTPKEYLETTKLVQSVNRNIHYTSVDTNMLAMTFYLVQMQGEVRFTSWWGMPIVIKADTILDDFLNGFYSSPWFLFGTDPVGLSREMLFFAFHYALTTRALDTFVVKGQDIGGKSARSYFLSTILTRYLDNIGRRVDKSMDQYRKAYVGRSDLALAREICDYETNPKIGKLPTREVGLFSLMRFTYAGSGDNGAYAVAGNQLSGLDLGLKGIRFVPRDADDKEGNSMDYKLTFVRGLMKLIEHDLLSTGQIKKAGDPHPDLDAVRAVTADLEKKKQEMIDLLLKEDRYWYQCLLRMQDVETMRQNRLYQEERDYFGAVYDLIQSGGDNQKFKDMYKERFNLEPRFDEVDDGKFRLSKYDLLMRMKNRVEKDIFLQPTAEETKHYGTALGDLVRPRPMKVVLPPGLERHPMVETAEATTLPMTANKEDFVRQGMLAFNGKSSRYIEWSAQRAGDLYLNKYLNSLLQVYYIGGEQAVSPERLTDVYLDLVERSTMDDMDEKNALYLGVDGVRNITFFEDFMVDKDSHKSFPLFYRLMKDAYFLADVRTTSENEVGSSVAVAKTLNNLGVFVFQPAPEVSASLAETYGEKVNRVFDRTFKLFRYLERAEGSSDFKERIERIKARSLYIQNGTPFIWDSNEGIYDVVTGNNLFVFTKDYVRMTGDLFKTSEVTQKLEEMRGSN